MAIGFEYWKDIKNTFNNMDFIWGINNTGNQFKKPCLSRKPRNANNFKCCWSDLTTGHADQTTALTSNLARQEARR